MTTSTGQFFHISPVSTARSRLEEAEHYYLLGNTDEALAAAQQAWREHPQEPDVFRVLAYLHMARGEYPPAEQAARMAVQLDGNNPASYATLAQVYLTFNVRQYAEQTLTVARQSFPNDAALLTLEADLRFRQVRGKEGATLAVRALELNPQDGYAKALLGTYRLRRRQYESAALFLDGAVAAYPSRWDYLRDYGIALVHERQYPKAIEMLIRAMELNPQDIIVQQYLHYALRFNADSGSLYWRLSFYFYRNSGLGMLLCIIGYLALLIGVFLSFMLAITQSFELTTAEWSGFLMAGGAALVYVTQSGVAMKGRKGPKFERYLRMAIEKLSPNPSSPLP